jgi:DNA-binding NtrC family response regulator
MATGSGGGGGEDEVRIVVVDGRTVVDGVVELTPARGGGVTVTDLGAPEGTYVGAVRVTGAVVPAGTVLRVGATRVRVELAPGAAGEGVRRGLVGLRGAAPVMQRLYASIERIARAGAAVLVTGESGTGKELVAQALHALGPRARAPFVTVDCGALPRSLIASELFGHERGAFTGAERQHVGAFERAHGGTLLLDEIGELPPEEQATLLGVLERRRFRRVGGGADVAVDVRVIVATHRDLRADADAGRFRLDLYFRLAVVTLRVPPLRERREDLPLLVAHFLAELGHAGPVEDVVPPELLARIFAHPWPGNVRELRNVVEATLLGESPALGQAEARAPAAPVRSADVVHAVAELPYREARATVMHHFEVSYLTRLLERAGMNVSEASRLARMDRSYLIELLRRHALRPVTGSSSTAT